MIFEAMRAAKGGFGRIECYAGVENRKEALRGSDFIVNAIQVGGYEPCTVTDFRRHVLRFRVLWMDTGYIPVM